MSASLPIIENCDNCGACCRHMVAPPFVIQRGRHEAVEKGVPPALLDEFLPVWETRLFVPESPCCWFDDETRRCRHYDLRPDACREFERGGPCCRESRRKWDVE